MNGFTIPSNDDNFQNGYLSQSLFNQTNLDTLADPALILNNNNTSDQNIYSNSSITTTFSTQLPASSFTNEQACFLTEFDYLNENNKDKLVENTQEYSTSVETNETNNINGLSSASNLLNNEKDENESSNHPSKKNSNRKRKKKLQDSDEGEKLENRKSKPSFKRRNIKKILTGDQLNESTLKALEDEKLRQERLNQIDQTSLISNLLLINNKIVKEESDERQNKSSDSSLSQSVNNSSDQSICIIEDDQFDNIKNSLVTNSNVNEKHTLKNEPEVIKIDDDDDEVIVEDDDCRVISESERQQDEQAMLKKKFRGIHMNDELNVPDVNGRVLVNVNHPLEDDDVFLLPYLSKNVKAHQIGGIRFIYDNIIESLTRVKFKDSGFGCILAHAMGLGKTLQTISFIEVFLRCTGLKQVLCIVPINTIQNWLSEFNYWLPENGQQQLDNDTIITYRRPFKVFVINDFVKTLKQRMEIIANWSSNGGVLLIGYEMFRTLIIANNKDSTSVNSRKSKNSNDDAFDEEEKASQIEEARDSLLNASLVICDEGHRIKNNSANIAKTLQKIKTKRRVVLTGYPLQNNLIEYWCMVDFVRPSYLGTKAEFSNMFERPIMNGQCIDSTREDVKLMRYRAHVLHSLLEGFVQRRGHEIFFSSLPKKQEYVILLKLSPIQKQFYLAFMEAIGAMNQGEKSNPLRSFAICCKIWNHPDVLYKFNNVKESEIDLDLPELQNENSVTKKKAKSSLSKVSSSQAMSSSTTYIQPQYSSPSSSSCVIIEESGFNPFANSISDLRNSNKNSFDQDWANKILESYQPNNLENGAKFFFSFTIIEQSVLAGDKILLFSQSLLSLNLIEDYLQKLNVPNTNEKWQKYKNYYRLDGSTAGIERERLINSFNQKNSPIWLFLLSTRAGCLGINLIGANRVIVLDASWNPCHDAQAVCRVYRYGQTKNCYIYRLIADHTMEKKIYDRQISKQTMSDRVIDEIQTENHFTRTEVEKLIHFVKEDVPPADLTNLSKKYDDNVLINSCLKHSNVITKEPFTHESLLIDKKEYQLSEREKAMAFRNYNHDKKYFPYSRPSINSSFYNAQTSLGYSPLSSLSYGKMSMGNSSSFNIRNANDNSNEIFAQNLDFNLHKSVSCNNLLSSNVSNYETSTINPCLSFPKESYNQNTSNCQSLTGLTGESGNNLSIKNGYYSNGSSNNMKNDYSVNSTEFNLKPPNSNGSTNQQAFNSFNQNNDNSITSGANQMPNLRDVKISCFIAPSKLVIPTAAPSNSSDELDQKYSNSIVIQPGEKVFILKTQKGCYLRTQDKKFIALRNKSTEDSFSSLTPISSFTNQLINNNSTQTNNTAYDNSMQNVNSYISRTNEINNSDANLFNSVQQQQLSMNEFSNSAFNDLSLQQNMENSNQNILNSKLSQSSSYENNVLNTNNQNSNSSGVMNDFKYLSSNNFSFQ